MDINMMLLVKKMYVLKKLGIDLQDEYPEYYSDFIEYTYDLLKTTDFVIESLDDLKTMALNYKINRLIKDKNIDFEKEYKKFESEFGKFLEDHSNIKE